MKKFVSVRTHYYKHEAAIKVLDHANSMRNGFTRSSNVHNEFSVNNKGVYITGSESCLDAYSSIREKHTSLKKKVPRSDMNTLFEHVVILSVEQYEAIESKLGVMAAKKHVMRSLRKYANEIQADFGFQPLGFDLHLDEGEKLTDGTIKRNIHAHVMFYNYDFKNKVAPLRGLMVRGKNPKTGKTKDLNPNFEKMQDLVASSFSNLGFERGISHGVDNPKHLKKAEWVAKSRALEEKKLEQVKNEFDKNKLNLEKLQNQVSSLSAEAKKINDQLAFERSNLDCVVKQIESVKEGFTLKQREAVKPFLDSLLLMTHTIDENSVRGFIEALSDFNKVKHNLGFASEIIEGFDNVTESFKPSMKR